MEKISDYITLLTPYALRLSLVEMLLLAFILILFILFFVLGVILRHQGAVAFLPLVVAFSLLVSAPWLVEIAMKKVFHPIELTLGFNQRLAFTNAFFVDGTITNRGQRNLKGCIVTIKLLPATSKKLEAIRYHFKPLAVKKELIETPLHPKQELRFQYTLDNLEFQGALTSKVAAECF